MFYNLGFTVEVSTIKALISDMAKIVETLTTNTQTEFIQ